MSWQTIEEYMSSLGYAEFTHGMCPECSEKIFQKKVYLESYQSICKAISSSISLNEVLNLIVTNVVKVMGVKASLLRLINKESRTLDLAAYYGLSKDYLNKGSVSFDKSIEDALSGKAVSIYDITENTESKFYGVTLDEGIRSILSIPLRFKDEVIGVLRMYTGEPVEYNEEDFNFVTAIAEQAAIAIMNAKEIETIVSKEKEYLRLFMEISKTISSSLSVKEVLNMIVRKIPEAMGLKAATITPADESMLRGTYMAAYGFKNEFLAKIPIDDEYRTLEALKTSPIAIYDVTKDNRIRYQDEARDEGIKSLLIVPMNVKNKLIGVLRLYSGWFRHFNQQDIDFAISLAEQCGIALENAKMYEKQYKDAKYLKTVQELTRLTTEGLDSDYILSVIVKSIPEMMNTKAATIRIIRPEDKRLELIASTGLSEKYLKRGTVEEEENIKLALKGKPVPIYDATNDPRIIYKKEAQKEGIKSILVVPLAANDKIIGVLRLLTDEYRRFSQDEIDFAMAIAEKAAICIEQVRMRRKITKEKNDR